MATPPPPRLQFWFEFASTYSYPAALRIGAAAERAGVEIEWRAFLLGPIFRDLGWRDSPFNLQEAKGRYMWRDLERECDARGFPFRRPSVFPRNGLLAARVSTAARIEPWLPSFVERVYRANFAEDRDISDPDVIADCLRRVGVEPEPVLARAAASETKASLREETERAIELGIFGAPSFIADGELYWGNDRLDQAIARAASTTART